MPPILSRSYLSRATLFLLVALVLNGCGQTTEVMHTTSSGAMSAPAATSGAMPSPIRNVPNRERYTATQENAFKQVSETPVSTFSIDVDTASYANVRRMLKGGMAVPKDAVRVEEMINYFAYDYAAPQDPKEPLNVVAKTFPTPWNPQTRLLHVGIKGYEIDAAERPAANLVFLIDVSGSMGSPEKLGLVQKSFSYLVKALRKDDTVSIVVYSSDTKIALKPVAGDQTAKIMSVINSLVAGGSTNGSAGLKMAYDLARENFDAAKVNRVLIATDGDFNFGETRDESLKDQIARERKSGIYLSVLGYGQGNLNDALMQKIAQVGNGVALYVDSLLEARKIFANDLFANIFPIANDVKIQVEFNPAQVAEYRLIGYETRLLKREDFTNDKVDAGEVGSGHAVTALYEYVPTGSAYRHVEPLRYGTKPDQAEIDAAAKSNETAYVRLRYKLPGESQSQEIKRPVAPNDAFTDLKDAPGDMRFASAVAGFAQLLKQSPYVQDFTYQDVVDLVRTSKGDDPFGYRGEFLMLVPLAEQ